MGNGDCLRRPRPAEIAEVLDGVVAGCALDTESAKGCDTARDRHGGGARDRGASGCERHGHVSGVVGDEVSGLVAHFDDRVRGHTGAVLESGSLRGQNGRVRVTEAKGHVRGCRL